MCVNIRKVKERFSRSPWLLGLLPLGLPMLLFASKRLRGAFSSLVRSCFRSR